MKLAEEAYDGPVSGPWGDEPIDSPADKDSGPKRMSAAHVVRFVEERYDVHATPAGEAFALPKTGAQLPIMLERKGGKLTETVAAALYDNSEAVVSTKTVEDAMRVIIARARQITERHELNLRVAFRDDVLVLDLGQPASAACVVIRPGSWRVKENPPPGIWFRRTAASRPLPTPVANTFGLDGLRRLLSFEAGDRRWLLIRGWLVAACFPEIPRPMLLALGAPGSAKTTRARLIVSVLDPRQELGSSFGKNITDDQTKALGRYLVSYDNLTGASEAISDHLCRLVTGDEIDKRVLYSDNELSTVSYRRTGALTAVNMPALRADALERVVVVGVDRIPEGNRVSEAGLRASFERGHAQILGDLCNDLAGTLQRLPQARAWQGSRPRMADYWDVLLALDKDVAQAYREAAEGAMVEAAEADPFVAAVTEWLAERQLPWRGETTEAWREASRHRESLEGLGSTSAAWWPKNASRFTDALTTAAEPLRAVGVESRRLRVNGRRLIEFTAVKRPSAGCEEGAGTGDEGAGSAPVLHPILHPDGAATPQVSALEANPGDEGDAPRGSSLLPTPERDRERSPLRVVPASPVTSVTQDEEPPSADHLDGSDPDETPSIPAHLADAGNWASLEPIDDEDRDGEPDHSLETS
ncbi:hypothetical protein [Kineococcus sp. R86509]|uniref:hypothetical protein n=1 Tax=Kineococcus sp. R86509 TaxID=3093851 RepID=UPI0036D22D6C